MKRIMIVITIMILTTTHSWGQVKFNFNKFPFSFVDDSLLYFNYQFKGSKPFHLKFNKIQTNEILNMLDTLSWGNNITHKISNVAVYKYNSITNKKYDVTFNVTFSEPECYPKSDSISFLSSTYILNIIVNDLTKIISTETISEKIKFFPDHSIMFLKDSSLLINNRIINKNDIGRFINYLIKYKEFVDKVLGENLIYSFNKYIDTIMLNGIEYSGYFSYQYKPSSKYLPSNVECYIKLYDGDDYVNKAKDGESDDEVLNILFENPYENKHYIGIMINYRYIDEYIDILTRQYDIYYNMLSYVNKKKNIEKSMVNEIFE